MEKLLFSLSLFLKQFKNDKPQRQKKKVRKKS